MTQRPGTGRTGSWCHARGLTALAAVVVLALPARAADGLEVTTFARAMQPGEVVRIDVTCTCGFEAPRATVFDKDIPLSPSGPSRWQGFAGIDLDVAPGDYPLTVAAGDGSLRTHTGRLRVAARQFPTRQLRVAPVYVDPPPETIDRILAEAARLDALFATVTPRGFEGPIAAPVRGQPSPNFGARSVFNGEARNPHAGIDYGSPTGTPVVAPGGGRVVIAEDLYFTGQTVVVDHGLGMYSVLAHLSAITVTEGSLVERGALVGRVGATGRATGPHLHWGVRLLGARVDPLSVIAAAR
jgi:murein DD-endopeptidase MepM/ murein hydrolase activator NlpD